MSSDSSSSDNDFSDGEDLHANVLEAFQVMKQHLNAAGLKSREHKNLKNPNLSPAAQNTSQQNISVPNKHRLIYKTFKTGNKKEAKQNSCQLEGSDISNEKNEPTESALGHLFIDNGPSRTLMKSSDEEVDTVVEFDLTNIGDSVDKDDDELELDNGAVNSTNIGDTVSPQPGTSSNAHYSSETDTDSDEELPKNRPVEEKRRKDKINMKKKNNGHLSSTLNAGINLTDVYIDVDPLAKLQKSYRHIRKRAPKHKEPEVMKKCVIKEDFERQEAIQSTRISVRQEKKQRKLEREKTKGGKWYNMPATELTEERKNDLTVIQMRKALDPKRFYKANDFKTAPKYFQFGRVVEDFTDFYSSRVPKKQRKATVVEELLADSEFRKFNKRKYEEVQDAKRHGKGPYKHMKRLKKRKK